MGALNRSVELSNGDMAAVGEQAQKFQKFRLQSCNNREYRGDKVWREFMKNNPDLKYTDDKL